VELIPQPRSLEQRDVRERRKSAAHCERMRTVKKEAHDLTICAAVHERLDTVCGVVEQSQYDPT